MVYRRNSQFKFRILIVSYLITKNRELLTLKTIDFQGT